MASQHCVQDGGVAVVDGTHQEIYPSTVSKVPTSDQEVEILSKLPEQPAPEISVVSSDDDEEDDDVHQCGRCKEVFRNLQLYIAHKSSKACKHRGVSKQTSARQSVSEVPVEIPIEVPIEIPIEVPIEVPIEIDSPKEEIPLQKENILEAAAKDTIYKQLQILVVDPEQSEQQQVEAILAGSPSNDAPVAFVAVQHENGQTVTVKAEELLPLNRPLVFGDSLSKKVRGRPRKSQPSKVQLSPTTGKPTTGKPMSANKPLTGKTPKGRTRGRPRTISLADFEDADVAVIESDEAILELEPSGSLVDLSDEALSRKRKGRPAIGGKPKQKSILMFTCSICKLEFHTKALMVEHKTKHTKLFKCKTCNEGFFTEEKLNKHMEKDAHHYECEHCGKVLVSKTSLQRHKAVHGEKSHICDVCARAFKTGRDMRNHKLGVHSTVKDYGCEVCGKAFARREKLKRHSLIHSPNRPCLQCPFRNHTGCEKTFYRKDKLTRHLYSHSKIKPFKCDHCQKTFARTDNLREHMRTHTGMFRYYCTVCGKGQPGPKKYLQHMLKSHNMEDAEVPPPLEDASTPEHLVELHKATIIAEQATRAARQSAGAARGRKKKQTTEIEEEIFSQQVSLHHATMVSSLSTVSLSQIAPLSTIAHAAVAAQPLPPHTPPGIPQPHIQVVQMQPQQMPTPPMRPVSRPQDMEQVPTPLISRRPSGPHPDENNQNTDAIRPRVSIPEHIRVSMPEHTRVTMPDHSRVTMPDHSRVTMQDHSRVTMPEHVRVTMPEHVRVTMPEHVRVTMPEHVRVTMPEHARVTMPEHARVTMPEHARVTMPEHARVTMPEHARVTMPDHVRVTMPDHVRVTMPDHVRVTMPSDHVRNTIQEHVRNTIPENVRGTMPEHIRNNVPEHIRSTITDHIRNNSTMPDHIRNSMPDLIRNNLPEHVRNTIPDHMRTTMAENIRMQDHTRVSIPDHGRSSVDHVRSPSELPPDSSRAAHSGQTGHTGHVANDRVSVSGVSVQMLPQSVIQQNMHFTNLLNSDLVNIGEAVVRNQNPLPVMSTIFKNFPNPPPTSTQ